MSVMEFILRMRDEASAGIQKVRTALTSTKDTAEQVKPGLEGLAGSIGKFGESFRRAQGAIVGALGVIGLVYATFKTVFEGAKKVMEWSGAFTAVEKLKQAQKTLSEAAEMKQKLAEFEDREKERIDNVSKAYDRQAETVGQLTEKMNQLAEAKQKAEGSNLNSRMTQINADERYAIASGYDPEAVKLQYDDERRRAKADNSVSTAKMNAESATAKIADAEKLHEIAVNRSIAIQDELNQAEADKVAARKALADLESQYLTAEEHAKKERSILYRDRKADITISQARRALTASGAQESSAADAVEVAKAQAAAAQAAVEDAMQTRADAEFQYQADVQAFWEKRDQDEREARQADLDAVKEQQAERKRLAEEQAQSDHEKRIENIKSEQAVAEQSAASAQDRLSRARSAAAQAWSWYRDPEAFKRQRADERADASAEKQFQKDARSLTSRANWRDARLDDRQEAVRRVVLAREEEQSAAQALTRIEENTRGLSEMLKQLLVMR